MKETGALKIMFPLWGKPAKKFGRPGATELDTIEEIIVDGIDQHIKKTEGFGITNVRVVNGQVIFACNGVGVLDALLEEGITIQQKGYKMEKIAFYNTLTRDKKPEVLHAMEQGKNAINNLEAESKSDFRQPSRFCCSVPSAFLEKTHVPALQGKESRHKSLFAATRVK